MPAIQIKSAVNGQDVLSLRWRARRDRGRSDPDLETRSTRVNNGIQSNLETILNHDGLGGLLH